MPGLCCWESEGPRELPKLPISKHWLTPSSFCRPPLQIAVGPGSRQGDPRGVVHQFLPPLVTIWLRLDLSPVPEFFFLSQHDCIAAAGTAGLVDL